MVIVLQPLASEGRRGGESDHEFPPGGGPPLMLLGACQRALRVFYPGWLEAGLWTRIGARRISRRERQASAGRWLT